LTNSKWKRGAAILEFALAWPVALLLVLGSVQLAVWGAESFAARSAALAGARAASADGSNARAAESVAIRVLAPSLVGARSSAWCPAQGGQRPRVWVCATELGSAIQVDIGGAVPALVPFGPEQGLPLRAHVVVQKEVFTR